MPKTIILKDAVSSKYTLESPANPITTGGQKFFRLDDLADVDASDEQDGYVPVFDSDSGTYKIQPISTSTDKIDGGTF